MNLHECIYVLFMCNNSFVKQANFNINQFIQITNSTFILSIQIQFLLRT